MFGCEGVEGIAMLFYVRIGRKIRSVTCSAIGSPMSVFLILLSGSWSQSYMAQKQNLQPNSANADQNVSSRPIWTGLALSPLNLFY